MAQYVKNTPYSSENLYLDSKNATLHNGLYNFSLDSVISASNTRMVIAVKEARFVNSFPNIRTGINDVIKITGSITGEVIYTIPEGYYNVKEFCDTFNSLSSIVCSYSNSTFKLTFTSPTEDFTITSDSNVIGIDGEISSDLGVIQMPLMMDFSSLDYIFIKSNIHLKNINHLGETSSTLLRFPLSMPFGYSFLYQPTDPTYHLSTTKSIKNIQISVTDKENNDLNLQNFNFQLIIEISFVYVEPERIYTQSFGTEIHPFEKNNENK
tara:strand:- start:4281 stop:5081 length:801 start_codon:yes stop_codon:yes gene_type:complete